MNAVNGLPVIGTGLGVAIAFLMLIVVTFGDDWAGSLVTVAHEGGHTIFAILAFRGPKGFAMKDGDNAGTELTDGSWGVGDIILTFAGYATPPLLGLLGAVLVTHGNVAGVLWISLILFIAAFFAAANPLAKVVTGLALFGVGWVIFMGSVSVRAAVALALVWLMLLGGLRHTFTLDRGRGSDPWFLAQRTLIPTIAWQGMWIVIAVLCLLRGGRLLLVA